MAYDKVIDSAVLNANLKSVADAIREKSGTSGNLAFPAGFAEAIAAIEVGGGGRFASGTITLAQDVPFGPSANFQIETGLTGLNEARLNFVMLLLNGKSNSGQYNTHLVVNQGLANCAMAYKSTNTTSAKYDTMYYDDTSYFVYDSTSGIVTLNGKNDSQKLNSFYAKSHISWAIWEE